MPKEQNRTTLEKKTKEELIALAHAMGGAPSSQSVKAQVIDLILDLANGNGAPEAEEAQETGAAEAETEDMDETGEMHESEESDEREESRSSSREDEGPEEESFERSYSGKRSTNSQSSNQSTNRRRRDGGREGGRDSRDRDSREGGRDRRPRQGQGYSQGRGQGGDNGETAKEVDVDGYLDLREDGYGFLRVNSYIPSRDDVYVAVRQIKQFDLRRGDYIEGTSRSAIRNEKNSALLSVAKVNGVVPEEGKASKRVNFEDLTPLFPDSQLRLEHEGGSENMTSRIIDLVSPIGKGQRGLIVSPPKAGKTTIMKEIARSIEINNPEVELIVLLVDERPEEVTDMKRWLKRGKVVASTFDRPAEEHIQVAEMTLEIAKRSVENSKDVVIILDGITRLARAYNLGAPVSGRIMSGGVDSAALYPPKRFFGAARNMEEGGSLTILATALVETGSKMDEVIFEEFKGTGNMEIRLDRAISERRIYPAIDVLASSTRHEELLFSRSQLQQVWKLRRVLSGFGGEDNNGAGSAAAGLELLIDRLKSFPDNKSFLTEIAKGNS